MTAEHPPRTLDDDYETGVLAFTHGADDVEEVRYVAAAEGPDGHLAGYLDTLELEDRVDEPPEGIHGWTTIGFAYVDLGDVEGDHEVWGDGVPLYFEDARYGVVEVRYSQMEGAWWTVPAYIETDPE